MNKIILLMTLICLNAYAQKPTEHTHAINPMLTQQIQAQEKQLDLKLQLQSLANKRTQDKVEASLKYLKQTQDDSLKHLELRQDVLNSQESLINWWLDKISIVLTIFSIIVAVAGLVGFFTIRGKFKEFNELKKKSEDILKEIKAHEKDRPFKFQVQLLPLKKSKIP